MCGLLLAGCAGSDAINADSGLELLALDSVNPSVVVPGTNIIVAGASFVEAEWGTASLRLVGNFDGSAVDVRLPAHFVDFNTMTVPADAQVFLDFGDGTFSGEATMEVLSSVDGELYTSNAVQVTLEFARQLAPAMATLQDAGLIFVNEAIAVTGSGLLLGGDEGTTYAVVEGCFQLEGSPTCTPVGPVDVPVVPDSAYDRSRGTFAFLPEIAGIRPGQFSGQIRLRNDQPTTGSSESSARSAIYDMIPPTVFTVSTTSASLGQYVDVSGGGFVGGASGSTLLRLVGTFTPTGAPSGAPVDLLLVPEFVDGQTVRYVINEDDSLGQALDLRRDTGTFSGQVTPITRFMADEVTGDGATMTLGIAPVKQVVYLVFKPSYVESLRNFGLRAADSRIRQRVVDAVSRDFDGVNVDVRTERPEDFVLYVEVDIAGPDPNGLGLFGYDNTPGKDTDNDRLYDRIGGVNATTQEDGFPGYGGVFIESLFGFSEHPGQFAETLPGADPSFDVVFDPFRPDRGGTQLSAADFAGDGVPSLSNGDSCPADDRPTQIACAVWVMGSLVGSTVSHEIGHSLGLANPYGEGFHNSGDERNRLMDGGSDRPFLERAELFGEGPARFCTEEYEYLQQILPGATPSEQVTRPSCF